MGGEEMRINAAIGMKYDRIGEVLAYGFRGREVVVRSTDDCVDKVECDCNLSIEVLDDKGDITAGDLRAKAEELRRLEPMRLLRAERDRRLQESDAMVNPDYPHSCEALREAWKGYRAALRDLPTHATPTLDDHGELDLHSVAFPSPPSPDSLPPPSSSAPAAEKEELRRKMEELQRQMQALMERIGS